MVGVIGTIEGISARSLRSIVGVRCCDARYIVMVVFCMGRVQRREDRTCEDEYEAHRRVK